MIQLQFSTDPTRTCEQCGKELTKKQRKERNRFCGDACYKAARTPADIRDTCAQCGKPLTAVQIGRRRDCCSRGCAARYFALPFVERLLSKIDRSNTNGCHPFTGKGTNGYGYLSRGDGQGNVLAHRAMYELVNGPIPDGLDVMHKCDNPPCCNPDHLMLGTRRDNTLDAVSKGRNVYGERCPTAVLTDELVQTIRNRQAETGETNRELALVFGVGKSTIQSVVARKSWKHVK